jgi:hypothetical protein
VSADRIDEIASRISAELGFYRRFPVLDPALLGAGAAVVAEPLYVR